jgi:iron complex outermembrane receptor protein
MAEMKNGVALRALAIALGFGLVAGAFASPALAQAPKPQVSAQEEVIVTARKRAEALKDVPLSVTALSPADIASITAGGADLTAFAARVPSLNVESSFGRTFPRFYIRGLGNTDFDINASQPVSVVFDDVVQENPILKGFPLFDVAQVEVLRGPQGTLFGRNTPAGVVKFDTVKPDAKFGGYGRVSLRSLKGVEGEAAIGGEIAPGLSGRLSMFVSGQEDWVDNGFTGESNAFGGYRDFAVRGQVRYQPNSRYDLLVSAHARDFDGTGQLFRANVVDRGSNKLNGNFDREKVFYDGGDGNFQKLRTYGGLIRAAYNFGPATLVSVSGYETIDRYDSRGDIDGGSGAVFLPTGSRPGLIPFGADTRDGIDGHRQFTQELRLESNSQGAFSWLAGAYYFDESLKIFSFNYDGLGGNTPNGEARQKQDTKAWAAFGSASWRPVDRLAITAGVRYSEDEKDFLGTRLIAAPFSPPLGPPVRVSTDDGATSWDLSATYALTQDVSVYGRVARGFRAPSIQGRLLFGDQVTTAKSEFLTSYEAGIKGDLFGGRLRTDISAFRYDVEDLQLTAVGGAGNSNRLVNAKDAEGYGAEADLLLRATDKLSLRAAVSYNKTEIKDAALRTQVCGAPCTVLDPTVVVGGVTLANINGNSFPNAPEWVANLSAEYRFPLTSGAEIVLNTDWAYKGDTNFFLYDSREFKEDGFWEGGVRATWLAKDGVTSLSAFGRNITDEEARVGAIDFNNLTGFVNQPRIWGIEAKRSF